MPKLLFVDHPYHARTGSSQFLIETIRKRFDVTVSQGIAGIDLASFDTVALFQVRVGEVRRGIRHRNLVFFPMYDDIGCGEAETWNRLAEVKVVSFCGKLHDAVRAYGISARYIQYYPEPVPGEPSWGSKQGVFFWQRTSSITWPLVKSLLGNHPTGSVHIHAAVDPGQAFVRPTEVEEQAYHVSYSDWLPTRASYLDLVSRNRFYVSPRLSEGIGLSFLEAMAMGRVVLAADRPTMNEYVSDGQDGLLFDPDSPTMLDFSRADSIAQNAKDNVADGRVRWNAQEKELLDFLMPTARPRRSSFSTRQGRLLKSAVFAGVRLLRTGWRWGKNILPYGLVVRLTGQRRRNG